MHPICTTVEERLLHASSRSSNRANAQRLLATAWPPRAGELPRAPPISGVDIQGALGGYTPHVRTPRQDNTYFGVI